LKRSSSCSVNLIILLLRERSSRSHTLGRAEIWLGEQTLHGSHRERSRN
jgi:hypothetical protein